MALTVTRLYSDPTVTKAAPDPQPDPSGVKIDGAPGASVTITEAEARELTGILAAMFPEAV